MALAQGQQALASDMNSMVPIGVPLPFFGNAANLPPDHLILDGGTIGDGSSGATARANTDTLALFTLLWNSISNVELVIQTSSGIPTSRGANAAADFADHKRLPLPDMRGLVMGGYKTADATFGTLGKIVGEATHSLTESELASHYHGLVQGNSSSANLPGAGSNGGYFIGYSRTSLGQPITEPRGSGAGHNNIQPTMTINWIIRYKSYA